MNKKDKQQEIVYEKKYYCSVHGGNGNPECKECWEKLYELAEDNNAYIIGP